MPKSSDSTRIRARQSSRRKKPGQIEDLVGFRLELPELGTVCFHIGPKDDGFWMEYGDENNQFNSTVSPEANDPAILTRLRLMHRVLNGEDVDIELPARRQNHTCHLRHIETEPDDPDFAEPDDLDLSTISLEEDPEIAVFADDFTEPASPFGARVLDFVDTATHHRFIAFERIKRDYEFTFGDHVLSTSVQLPSSELRPELRDQLAVLCQISSG